MKQWLTLGWLAITSSAVAGSHDIYLLDQPAVHIPSDLEYEVLSVGKKGEASIPFHLAYMLVPKDQQSSAVLTIGDGFFPKTEDTIAKMFEGAKVTKVPGLVGGNKVEWWHYRDQHHFYSSCLFKVSASKGRVVPVDFELVANTQQRLEELENSFSKIEMIEKGLTRR